jgi:CheY-like chemotaxis protein
VTSKHVLVIDDDLDNLELIKLSLEAYAGWRVTTASDGIEGLKLASTEQPDLVLLDVMMPRPNGPEVLAALRADESTRTIPVVLLTAIAYPDELRQLAALEPDGLLTKPFSPALIAMELETMLSADALVATA